jgi:hypothetical protein
MTTINYFQHKLFSKQGKAISQTQSMVTEGTKKRPKAKPLNIIDPSDEETILQLIKAQKLEKPFKKVFKQEKPTSPFRSVSREKYENAFRNRTESPHACRYNPVYTAIDIRVNQGPKYMNSKSKPREKKIVLPVCVDDDLKCNFPIHSSTQTQKHNRATYSMSKYNEMLSNKEAETFVIKDKIVSPIDFKVQKPRDPFVRPSNSPHEERFNSLPSDTVVHSKNRKLRTVSFNKAIGRDELIKPKPLLDPYDVNDEFVKPNTALALPDFRTMTGRKPNLIAHQLSTPISPDLNLLDNAFFKQSTVRG